MMALKIFADDDDDRVKSKQKSFERSTVCGGDAGVGCGENTEQSVKTTQHCVRGFQKANNVKIAQRVAKVPFLTIVGQIS